MGYNDYKPTDYNQGNSNFTEGDYRIKIIKVEATTSRNSGKDMIALEFSVAEARYTFRYYLVDNEYFDANATKLFDCFKLQRGNFALESWIGKYGRGHIAKGKAKDDGKQYWELAYLIVDAPVAKTNPAADQQNYPPPRQPPAKTNPAADEFTDDIPF